VVAAVVAALSVVGASCSSGGTPAANSSTTTTNSSQDIAADKALAREASLKRTDFPAGWVSTPESKSNQDQALTVQLARCLDVSPTQLSQAPAQFESPTFTHVNTGSASNTAGYRATAAEQKSSFDILSSPKAPECFTKAVQTIIKSAAHSSHSSAPTNHFGQLTFVPLSFPTFGDATIAYRVEIPISYSLLTITEYLDLVFSIKGRADALLFFSSTDNPFPADQEQYYTGLVVGRLKNTT
jgi:hypothetical protein